MIRNELFFVEGTIEDDASELESARPSRTLRTVEGLSLDRPAPRSKGAMRGDTAHEDEPTLYNPRDIHFGSRSGSLRAKPNTDASHFSIGMPVVHALEDLLVTNAAIPAYIRHQLESFEFHWVQLACSFVAAPSHAFQNAKFQVTILTEDPTSIVPMVHPAMAYSLYPDRLEDEYQFDRKVSLSPELKLSASPFEATLPLPGIERSLSGASFQARVEAYGLQDTTCGWIFARNASHELSGSHRLYLLVRKPRMKDVHVRAIFHLSASVQKQNGPLQFLKMKYKSISGEIVEVPSYPLC